MGTSKLATAMGLVSLAATSLLASQASASGVDTARFGSEYGYAAGQTPFALYYNPAALATTSRLHIATNLTLAVHNATYRRSETSSDTPDGAEGANTGKGKVRDLLTSPAAAVSYRISDFVIGVGVFAPFAGLQSWGGGGSYPGYPGARDGAARWHLIEGGTTSIYGSLGASYTYQPLRLSLGVVANLNYNTLEFTRAQTASGTDDLRSEGRTYVDVAAITGSFGVGVMWEALASKLWLGLSYQAPPGMYKDIELDGELRTLLNPTQTDAGPAAKVTLHQRMPDIIRLGIRYAPSPRYELRLAADYSRWSAFEKQCLTARGAKCSLNGDGSGPPSVINNQMRKWQDAWGVKLGGSYFISQMWEAMASVGYDGNPVPLGMLDASVIDGHDLTFTGGGRVRISDLVGILLSYSYTHWLERDSTGKSRLASFAGQSRLPSSSGIYTQNASVITAMVEVYLD